MRFLMLIALIAAGACQAEAADLSVTARDRGGKPVGNAVVMVYPGGKPASAPFKFPWPARMAQQNITFDPFVLIVPVGAEVSFPNLDKVRHHVYSFSPGARFELKLYGHDESRKYRFTTAGAAAIGCNIHDQMVAFIKVVDTPYAAKTDASGAVTVRGVPAGPVVVKVWLPNLKAPKNEMTLPVKALAEGVTRQSITLDLRGPS